MVESEELLKNWPSWRKPSADKVLASPAWRMEVSFARTKDTLTIAGSEGAADEIYLQVKLDGVEHVLGIRDSERFPDLHLVWSQRKQLDPNLVLALVEKECGALFVLIEHVFGRDFSVSGLAETPTVVGRTVFRTSHYSFSFDLSSELRLQLGDLSYLDTTHPSIRTMTRPARADYAAVELDDETRATLAEGDVIPLGAQVLSSARWNLGEKADGLIHVVAADETQISFAAFADGVLPSIEPVSSLLLVRHDRVLAEGEWMTLGEMPCFKLTHMRS